LPSHEQHEPWQVQHLKDHLEEYGPFDAVIDGANLAYTLHGAENGGFSFS